MCSQIREQTPADVLGLMRGIGEGLGRRGWLLRSGGAEGADSAHEAGCDLAGGAKEIYLPWKRFRKNPSPLFLPSPEAVALAAATHPAWEKCSRGARLLHARNCHQALGKKLDDPVSLVVCWTMGGGVRGGTATAMRLAAARGARVVNLFEETWDWSIADELERAA